MLGFLLFLAILGLITLQFFGWRSSRWARRWHEWYKPTGRMMVKDAEAMARMVAGHMRGRRAVREIGDPDAELRKLLGN